MVKNGIKCINTLNKRIRDKFSFDKTLNEIILLNNTKFSIMKIH
jgi:hypothetical protein